MFKKIFVLFLTFCFLISNPAGLLAAPFLFENEDEPDSVITVKENTASAESGYHRITCPTCRKAFEIRLDPNDTEFKQGIKKFTCPYDGTTFYPATEGKTEQELQYETVRCPDCGREFKSYIDIKAILAGQPQTIICPYTKYKFYFTAEGIKPIAKKMSYVETVMCPTDKRTFKAYVDPKNLKELTCPYDGTKFYPTPELIMFKDPVYGTRQDETVTREPSEGLYQPFSSAMPQELRSVNIPAETQKGTETEKPSRIEQMFSENIPLSVSTAIKQFGYDVFKPVKESPGGQGEKGDNDKIPDQASARALKSLLGAKGQEGVLSDQSEGGFSGFSAPTQIPAINDYVLGPGDTLQISVWGQIQDVFSLTVDAEGKILLPKIGPVYVWGLRFEGAEKLIKETLSKVYTNIEMSVSIGKLRGIKVFVLGETEKPGAYNVSALANAFHAIYAAGGPTKVGTMRKIKLTRKGSQDVPIDLYNVLLKGDSSQDYKLQAGDVLFIRPIGDVAGIAGNVKRPAIYELDGKIKLSELIEMAGGLSSVGYLQRIQVERIQDHMRKVVMDLEFKSSADLQKSDNNLEMQDGDLVLIFPITALRYNFVSIQGNILRPGDYELKKNMRLKELIEKAGGILPGAYLERAEVSRFSGKYSREVIPVNINELMDGSEDANLTLKEWDAVTVYSKKEVLTEAFVEISGAVNKPGSYELTENMTVSDLIFKAGGMKPAASMENAELFRNSAASGSKIINIDLNKALSRNIEDSARHNFVLEASDSLFVKEDITQKNRRVVVSVSGEFKYPGEYVVEKGTKLSEVINKAGGFTKDAYLDGVIYTRESVRKAQQKMMKNFLEFEEQALLQEQSSMAVGLTPVQAESREKLIAYRQTLMKKLEVLRPTGRILINLDSNPVKFASSEYDIVVEDGDSLTVPVVPSTVQVIGNVYGAGTLTFREGKGVDYYISKVGGLTKYADPNRIFVIRANGETISSFVKAVKIRRGDTIVVPEEFKYKTLPGLVLKDIVQVIYQAALGAAVTITAINTM